MVKIGAHAQQTPSAWQAAQHLGAEPASSAFSKPDIACRPRLDPSRRVGIQKVCAQFANQGQPHVQHNVQVGGVPGCRHRVHVAKVFPLVLDEQPVVLVHEQRLLGICGARREMTVMWWAPDCSRYIAYCLGMYAKAATAVVHVVSSDDLTQARCQGQGLRSSRTALAARRLRHRCDVRRSPDVDVHTAAEVALQQNQPAVIAVDNRTVMIGDDARFSNIAEFTESQLHL